MRAGLLVSACVIATLLSTISAAAESDGKLAQALMKEDQAAVRALLQQKVGVNAPLVDGTTPLHLAVRAEDLTTVEALIKAGADVRAHNRYGLMALHIASTAGNAAIVSRLLKAARMRMPLMRAARRC